MSERIVYTLHALERVRQRKIPLEAVRSCLIDPDRVVQEGNTKRAVKRVNDRALVVVYREEGQRIIVITAFLSSRADRYLKR